MLPKTYLYRINNGSLSVPEVSAFDCLHPKRLWVYDSDTGSYMPLVIGCSDCVRCADKVRDSWTSRMCLHSFHYKWCYYITLTYGSYNLFGYLSHPAKNMWQESLPVRDSFNYSHSPKWTPSILVRSHLTNFIKRLRKNVSSPLSYCGCGEYGSSADGHGYARPHFHLIIWSDAYLTKKDIQAAWSFDCCRTNDPRTVERWTGNQNPLNRFSFKIGNVEFENLTASGALDWNGIQKVVRRGDSSPDCFAYVAKYVGKREKTPKSAFNRLSNAFAKLPNPDDEYFPGLDHYQFIPGVKCPISTNDKRCLTYNKKFYDSISKDEFISLVSPFFACSRAYAIGKSYLLDDLTRLSRKSYSLPKFQGKQLAYPSYFARMVSQQRYPVRIRQKSALCSSLVKGCLPRVFDYFSALRDNADTYYSFKSIPLSPQVLPESSLIECSSSGLVVKSGLRYIVNRDLVKGSNYGCLYDVSLVYPDGIIRYDYSPAYDMFFGYKFNRSTRSYDLVDPTSRVEFCDRVLSLIQSEWSNLSDRDYSLECSNKLYDLVESHPGTPSFRKNYLRVRKEKSLRYKAHKRVTGDVL